MGATEEVRGIVAEIASLLEAGGELNSATMVRDALSGSEDGFERFLVSNELWGGAGSIADQALIQDRDRRRTLETLLITLGQAAIEGGKTNARTQMWVDAFVQWLAARVQ